MFNIKIVLILQLITGTGVQINKSEIAEVHPKYTEKALAECRKIGEHFVQMNINTKADYICETINLNDKTSNND